MSVHFTHWLTEAEKLNPRMSDLRIKTGDTESELAVDCLRRLERAARCLVADAYMDPNKKLQEAGVCTIRVGTVSFADVVECLTELQQIAEYYRAPTKVPDGD